MENTNHGWMLNVLIKTAKDDRRPQQDQQSCGFLYDPQTFRESFNLDSHDQCYKYNQHTAIKCWNFGTGYNKL